jgi:hypothetical protein
MPWAPACLTRHPRPQGVSTVATLVTEALTAAGPVIAARTVDATKAHGTGETEVRALGWAVVSE